MRVRHCTGDFEAYVARSRALDLSSIPWSDVPLYPLPAEAVRTLLTETARYLRTIIDQVLARQFDLGRDIVGEGVCRLRMGRDLVRGVQPSVDDAGQDLLVKLFLGVEVVMQVGFRDGGTAGDLGRLVDLRRCFKAAIVVESAAEDVRRSLEDLRAKGAKSFMLDLRGNGGGSLEQALEIEPVIDELDAMPSDENCPPDLSTNKKYMEGYGQW